jgi:REP element-mobilizing transposase RayT
MGIYHRRSIRLKGYDYSSPGAYFVTLVTFRREALFGEIVKGEMQLNSHGQIVREEWFKTAAISSFVRLEQAEFVIMPNHIHGILWFEDNFVVGATCQVAPTSHRKNGPQVGSLGYVIGQFKSITTRRINAMSGAPGVPLWQRNYYEHIIRTESELSCIRQYILANPHQWYIDQENPIHHQE